MWFSKRQGFLPRPGSATRGHRRGKATASTISVSANPTKRDLAIPAAETHCRSYRVRSPNYSRVRLGPDSFRNAARSEEHTSELQSLMRISYAVFCQNKETANPDFAQLIDQ